MTFHARECLTQTQILNLAFSLRYATILPRRLIDSIHDQFLKGGDWEFEQSNMDWRVTLWLLSHNHSIGRNIIKAGKSRKGGPKCQTKKRMA